MVVRALFCFLYGSSLVQKPRCVEVTIISLWAFTLWLKMQVWDGSGLVWCWFWGLLCWSGAFHLLHIQRDSPVYWHTQHTCWNEHGWIFFSLRLVNIFRGPVKQSLGDVRCFWASHRYYGDDPPATEERTHTMNGVKVIVCVCVYFSVCVFSRQHLLLCCCVWFLVPHNRLCHMVCWCPSQHHPANTSRKFRSQHQLRLHVHR